IFLISLNDSLSDSFDPNELIKEMSVSSYSLCEHPSEDEDESGRFKGCLTKNPGLSSAHSQAVKLLETTSQKLNQEMKILSKNPQTLRAFKMYFNLDLSNEK